jgi:hypothetical protein
MLLMVILLNQHITKSRSRNSSGKYIAGQLNSGDIDEKHSASL